MILDIPTIIIITVFLHLLQIPVFIYQYFINRSIKGLRWLIGWSLLESFAFGLMLFRGHADLLPFIIPIQNPLLIAGTFSILVGIRTLFQKPVPWKILVSGYAIFLIIHLWFSLVNESHTMRTLNTAVFLSVMGYLCAYTIWKFGKKDLKVSSLFLAIVFFIHGAVFTWRIFSILTGHVPADMLVPSAFNLVQMFDGVFAGLLWTIGFIILINHRLTLEVAESQQHFEQVFNTSPDAMVITQIHDGKIVNVNEAFENLSGFKPSEVIGNSVFELNLWANPDERAEIVRLLEEQGYCANKEAMFLRKDRSSLTALVSARILNIQGNSYIISNIRDISDRKAIEEATKIQNEQLLRLNAERDRFYSIIAHDLRSPFNSFLGLTKVMVETLPDLTVENIGQMLASMEKSAANLYTLLENLLAWSTIQQGLMPFDPRPFNLSTVARECLDLLNMQITAKKITIEKEIPDDLSLVADPAMIAAMLRNFLSNAIKFTPEGGTIRIIYELDKNSWNCLSVRDNGIGMPPEIISSLFRFDTKNRRSGTAGEPSAGLGLMLCQEFAAFHRGKIEVESPDSGGSVFRICFPAS